MLLGKLHNLKSLSLSCFCLIWSFARFAVVVVLPHISFCEAFGGIFRVKFWMPFFLFWKGLCDFSTACLVLCFFSFFFLVLVFWWNSSRLLESLRRSGASSSSSSSSAFSCLFFEENVWLQETSRSWSCYNLVFLWWLLIASSTNASEIVAYHRRRWCVSFFFK